MAETATEKTKRPIVIKNNRDAIKKYLADGGKITYCPAGAAKGSI